MPHHFDPAPRRCRDLACRRSAVCRRPYASACLTSPANADMRRRQIAAKLDRFLLDIGRDPDASPPPDALPIEETIKIILAEADKRRAKRA